MRRYFFDNKINVSKAIDIFIKNLNALSEILTQKIISLFLKN